jgi:hypothetical protein
MLLITIQLAASTGSPSGGTSRFPSYGSLNGPHGHLQEKPALLIVSDSTRAYFSLWWEVWQR